MVLEVRPELALAIAEKLGHLIDVSLRGGAVEQQNGRVEVLDGRAYHVAIDFVAG